jgi:hypothetical protein
VTADCEVATNGFELDSEQDVQAVLLHGDISQRQLSPIHAWDWICGSPVQHAKVDRGDSETLELHACLSEATLSCNQSNQEFSGSQTESASSSIDSVNDALARCQEVAINAEVSLLLIFAALDSILLIEIVTLERS